MGIVFGKTNVAEPAYQVLFHRTAVTTPYEIRKYGERFAAATYWNSTIVDSDSSNSNDKNENDRPFTLLAKYIGVFGKPENEGSVPITMTAPVMKQQNSGTLIAMTAPVIKGSSSVGTNDMKEKSMMFVLPEEYKSIESIPQPTNPAVHIVTIPPSVGAVYSYSGSMSDETAQTNALKLGTQLQLDLDDANNNTPPANTTDDDEDSVFFTKEYVLNHYQYWGYNPPFTLPMFRRNEIWIELTTNQVDKIVNKGLIITTESN